MYITRFKKDILKLLISSVFIKALQMIILPIYTREFVLEAFGYKALFSSLSGFIGVLCCLKYEQAILISRDEESTHNLFFLSSLITLLISLVIVLIISLDIVRFFPNSLLWIDNIKWYLPFDFLLNGLFILLNQWNTKLKLFSLISISNVLSSIINIVLTINYLFLNRTNEYTFIINAVHAKFLTILVIFFILNFKKKLPNLKNFSIQKIRSLLIRYGNFPKYGLPAALLGNASFEIPTLLMGIFFSSSNLGLFSIAKQIITIPITFIQEIKFAIAEKSASSNSSGDLPDLILNLLKKTIFIFSSIYLLLAIYGRFYFEFIFGKEYQIAGTYAQILSISGYFLLLSTPMIPLFSILEREDLRLRFAIFNIISRVLPIIIFGLIGDFKLVVICIGISEAIVYLVKTEISLKMINRSFKDISSFIFDAFYKSFIPVLIIGSFLFLETNKYIFLIFSLMYILYNFVRGSKIIRIFKPQ